jgi:hypothetical protein
MLAVEMQQGRRKMRRLYVATSVSALMIMAAVGTYAYGTDTYTKPKTETKRVAKSTAVELERYRQIDRRIEKIEKDVPLLRRMRATDIDTWPEYTAFYDENEQMSMLVVDYSGEDSTQTNSYYYDRGRLVAVETYFGRFGLTPEANGCIYKGTIRFYLVDGMCMRCTTEGKVGKIKWADLNPALRIEPEARRAIANKHAHRPVSEQDFQRQFMRVVGQVRKGQINDKDLGKLHAYLREDMPVGYIDYDYWRKSQLADAVIATGSVKWMKKLQSAAFNAFEPNDILRFAGTKPQAFFGGVGYDPKLLADVRKAMSHLWQEDVRDYLLEITAYIGRAPQGPAREMAESWAAELRKHQERKADEIPVIISVDDARNPFWSPADEEQKMN